MYIRTHLFSRSNGQNPDLYDVLEARKRLLVNQIAVIASLDEMTDKFLTELVQKSLIRPLTLARREDYTREGRTEVFAAHEIPDHFSFDPIRGQRYPKTVFRISVPFTGNPDLFTIVPSGGDFKPPVGQISGSEVQFDVVLWGYEDDAQRAEKRITENLTQLERYVGLVNQQVRVYNECLSTLASDAFKQKLEKLTGQHAIFDSLGIKEKPKVQPMPINTPSFPQSAKRNRPPEQIITYIQHIYVESINRMEVEVLNQTNSNGGNVNNQIHSS
jgi:hypothetical protein